MGIPLRQVITRSWVSTAIAVCWCVASAASAGADPDERPAGPEPFASLRCDCLETAPKGSAAREDGFRRGIRDGLAAALPAGRPGG